MSELPPDDLPLAAEFPSATYEQWRNLAEAALKGARYEDRLRSRTADGLTIEPLYARAGATSQFAARAPGARWQVLQRVDHPDPAAAHVQALDDLNGGASGLLLVSAGSVGAHGYGLNPTSDTIEAVLDGVDLNSGIAIEFDLSPQSNDFSQALGSLLARRRIAPESVNVRFGFDPLGSALFGGGLQVPWDVFGHYISRLVEELTAAGFRRSLLAPDGRVVHDAGGTEAQELAYVIAAAVTMLRALEAEGTALEDARRMIFFRLAADTDQFLTIAKFRALRQLWQRVADGCRLAPEPIFISAETAWRTMTRNDPAVNILRATLATFAAGIGGSDAITVLPFTAARGLPNGFARRVARNTQLVLLDEANLARVADPTAGTGWCEELTAALCRAAWALFQEIEGCGGAPAALKEGLIQSKVNTARSERERAVATRQVALIGANEFPDIGDAPAVVLDATPVTLSKMAAAVPIEPLVPMRLAEPFEELRDASDRMLAATGQRPKIFLASLGSPADFTPRANFAKNFFEAGGIEAIVGRGVANNEEIVAAFKASGTRLACLCATDKVSAGDAVKAASALAAAGASYVSMAGRPGALENDLRTAGVQSFIHGGCDMLAMLREVHRRLAV